MTQVLIDRATLEQLVDCPASDYERMYALTKQLRAALAGAESRKVEKVKRREPTIDLGKYAGTYGGYITKATP